MDVSKEDIKRKILSLPSPFCSAKRINSSYSSSSSPSTQITEQCFQELQNKSLGISKKLQKSIVFYKALPSVLAGSEHHLGALNPSPDDHKGKFLKKYDLLPSSKRDKMVENHPMNEELRIYLL